jgi:hypothetical protein
LRVLGSAGTAYNYLKLTVDTRQAPTAPDEPEHKVNT